MFHHILCPIDGSVTSIESLDLAARFAAETGAKLTICMAVAPSKAAAMAFGDAPMSAACFDALEDEAKQILTDAAARVAHTVSAETARIDGEAVDSIVDYAAASACDLIVIGSHGRTGLKRALLGSVAEGVVRHAGVPVLVVRRAPVETHAIEHEVKAAVR